MSMACASGNAWASSAGDRARSTRRSLFRQWSDQLVYFSHTGAELTAEQREQFAALDVEVTGGEISGFEIVDDELVGVRLVNGEVVDLSVLVVAPRFAANSEVLNSLGLTTAEHTWGIGVHVPGDPTGRTSVSGVWVAGNITDLTAGVVPAAAGGVTAAAAINMDLITEDTAMAAGRHRER